MKLSFLGVTLAIFAFVLVASAIAVGKPSSPKKEATISINVYRLNKDDAASAKEYEIPRKGLGRKKKRKCKKKKKSKLPLDCSTYHDNKTGIMRIRAYLPRKNLKVLCDNVTSPGGWTIIQRRFNGSVNFYRTWKAYERGFGKPNGEYWLGLTAIHKITHSGDYMLRIELENKDGETAYSEYPYFKIAGPSHNYQLTIGEYLYVKGRPNDAGDSMTFGWNLNGTMFSTKDRDNDYDLSGNCAVKRGGGWWFDACSLSNLNGNYFVEEGYSTVSWYGWKGNWAGMKATKMLIRKM